MQKISLSIQSENVIFIPDLHLVGFPGRKMLNPDESKILSCLEKIIADQEIVIFCGDLLEGFYTDTKEFLRSEIGKRFLAIIKDKKNLLLVGNHDPEDIHDLAKHGITICHEIEIIKDNLIVNIAHGDKLLIELGVHGDLKIEKRKSKIILHELTYYMFVLSGLFFGGRTLPGKIWNGAITRHLGKKHKNLRIQKTFIFGHTHFYEHKKINDFVDIFFLGNVASGQFPFALLQKVDDDVHFSRVKY